MSEDEERLAKYEARIVEIEARQAELEKNRGGYAKFFVAAPIVSAIAFYWGTWIGAGSFFTGILICVFGFYTVRMRAGEYVRELTELETVAEHLRAKVPISSRSRPP